MPQIQLEKSLPSRFHVGYAHVGSSNSSVRVVDVTGFNFSSSDPVVTCQPQDDSGADTGDRDSFAVQVAGTTKELVTLRIRRLDQNTGWGQNLRINIMAVG